MIIKQLQYIIQLPLPSGLSRGKIA
jgi:hypothetical protein